MPDTGISESREIKATNADFTLKPEDTKQIARSMEGLRWEYLEAEMTQCVMCCLGTQGWRVFGGSRAWPGEKYRSGVLETVRFRMNFRRHENQRQHGMKTYLKEKIGNPDLFTGRKKELAWFLKWIDGIKKGISKSTAIVSRRKTGKTAFLQRVYNLTYEKNDGVIPFYYELGE